MIRELNFKEIISTDLVEDSDNQPHNEKTLMSLHCFAR